MRKTFASFSFKKIIDLKFCSLHHGQQNIMIKNTYYIKTVSVYVELDSMMKHRTQFAFKDKRDHISKVNIPNKAYPSQYIDIQIPHGSNTTRDKVIIPNTVKITFNLDITSTEKARSVVKNAGRALVKQKVMVLGSKEVDTINNSDIYVTYKDLYLSKKEHGEKLLQGIQWTNELKAWVGAKKSDGITLRVTTQKNAIKST